VHPKVLTWVTLVLRITAVGILQNLDMRLKEGHAGTWEDDWEDHSLLIPGELPVVFSDRR
jgi:hypothetical protein